MKVRVMAFVVLAAWFGVGCGDDAAPDSGVAGTGAAAGTGGASGTGGGGGGISAGKGGTSAAGTGGQAGAAGLGSDACGRAPADACDLLSACASVKARRNCAGPIMFVACAPKQRNCAQTASFCAKDATGAEWFFPTSCGKEQIQQSTWTIEATCGCPESDAGAEDAGL
jgi:hypothetical protein